jgi:hypothetical protein
MHEEVKTIQGSILLKEMAQKAAVLKKKIWRGASAGMMDYQFDRLEYGDWHRGCKYVLILFSRWFCWSASETDSLEGMNGP